MVHCSSILGMLQLRERMSDVSGTTIRYKVRTFRFYGYTVAAFPHHRRLVYERFTACNTFLPGTGNDMECRIFMAVL